MKKTKTQCNMEVQKFNWEEAIENSSIRTCQWSGSSFQASYQWRWRQPPSLTLLLLTDNPAPLPLSLPTILYSQIERETRLSLSLSSWSSTLIDWRYIEDIDDAYINLIDRGVEFLSIDLDQSWLSNPSKNDSGREEPGRLGQDHQ